MSIDRSGSFSETDMDAARRISRRLAGEDPAARAPPADRLRAPAPPAYVRFRASRIKGSKVAPESTALEDAWNAFGAAGWNATLDRCMEVTGTTSAFMMDENGLVVACRGELATDDAQGLGARLLVMLEQADHMDARGRRSTGVTIELGDAFLTGIRGPREAPAPFTLGLFGSEPVGRVARAEIDRLLGRD